MVAQVLKSILTRLNNKGTIIALVSLIISLVIQFGVDVDANKYTDIATTICNILILLGVLNDPTTSTSAYIPGISDKLVDNE